MVASKVKKTTVKKEKVVKGEKKVAKKKTLDALEVTVAVPEKKTPVKKVGLLDIDVVDITGKVAETITLPKAIFGVKINKQLIAQAVRVYLANQRKGSASTKTRGEVRGSTRKIYRQKGTGKARHGGIRAPIFVHGGIAHGPRPHDFSLSLPKKMKKVALFSALTEKLAEGGIKVVTGLEKVAPKTKEMAQILKKLIGENKKNTILLVLPEEKADKYESVFKAARNISQVELIAAQHLNTYEIITHKVLLFARPAIEAIEKHFAGKKII